MAEAVWERATTVVEELVAGVKVLGETATVGAAVMALEAVGVGAEVVGLVAAGLVVAGLVVAT